MRNVFRAVLVSVVLFCGSPHAQSQELGLDGPALTDSDRQVMELVDKLESDRFSERTRASRELQEMGAAAHRSLERVVAAGGADAANRAYQLLARHFKSSNTALSQSAEESLRRIAANTKNPKSLSAEQLLNPPKESGPGTPNAKGNPIIRRAPVIRKQIQIQTKSINGRTESSITENGRKFKFIDDGNTIKVERPDGKGGVKKAEYKDKEELKDKDKEAYDMFKRVSGNGNRIQIQFGQRFGGKVPGFAPIQPRIRIQIPPGQQLQPRQQPKLQPLPRQDKQPLPNPPAQPKKPKLILT